jgi:hypothetical protein
MGKTKAIKNEGVKPITEDIKKEPELIEATSKESQELQKKGYTVVDIKVVGIETKHYLKKPE